MSEATDLGGVTTTSEIPDRLSSGPEQPRMSMRHRIARFGRAPQASVLDPLFKVMRSNHPKADTALVERAYRTAEHYHRGQLRKSGDPYITHPLAVATILAELGLTGTTLCAALLHDTVEDTSYTLEQLRADFGDEVARMVDGVTKLDKVTYGDSAQAETIRKMVVAMARDIRVLVIKLADRLHNMRTLHFLRPDKQTRIAKETLDIFAPLAHRLGMNAVKWELEDLAFSVLHPKIYAEIVQLVAERAPQRERLLAEVTEIVNSDLKNAKIRATVHGRPKHYYSIYQKMVVRGRDFADIYDLVGLRVLVDTPRDCYAALGVMHVRWNPLPGRFKDYIAVPKFNMYQSLHTTVLGPTGKPVELQIRTQDMHRRAEYGVAAHWKYKENPAKTAADNAVNPDGSELSWVRSLTEWQKETADPGEFLEALRYEINSAEVYVYTPKGEVITLPADSTPVDFAYAIHTEVGQRCIGARVNGRLVPLESPLVNGDVVDIMTSKAEGAGPSRDWLEFVASPKARNKIKQYFSREQREANVDMGREMLAKQVRKAGLPIQSLLTLEHVTAVAHHFRLADVTALYAAIGRHQISAQAAVQRLIAIEGGTDVAAEEAAEMLPLTSRRSSRSNDTGVSIDGDSDLWVKLARCCTPVPGDDIMGFITRGSGVSVHRTDCTNAGDLRASPDRLVDVSWAPTAESSFLVAVQVEGLDREKLLHDMTRVVSEHHVSIVSATLSTDRNRLFKARMTFKTPDPRHLESLLQAIRRVAGVYDVFRVQQ